MALRRSDLLDAVTSLHGCDDLDSLSRQMRAAVRLLVPCDAVGYAEANSVLRRSSATTDDPGLARLAMEVNPALEHFMHEHPLIQCFNENPAATVLKLTDFHSQGEIRQTGLYREYFQPLGIEYQVAIGLESLPDLSVVLTLNRFHGDFKRFECDRLEEIYPHLREAYRHVMLQEKLRQRLADDAGVLDDLQIGICTVTHLGRIMDEMPFVRKALLATFEGHMGRADVLPPPLKDWLIATHRRFLSGEAPQAINASGVFHSGKGTLTVRVLRMANVRGEITLLLRFQEHFDPIARLHRDGLTRREAEVLYRLTLGETDKEIAKQLGMRPNTARTHVERIRGKLGVPTRTAATRIGLGWLQGPG